MPLAATEGEKGRESLGGKAQIHAVKNTQHKVSERKFLIECVRS